MTRKIPDLHLEQARLGERAVDDDSAAAVAALAADDAAFLAALPPSAMAKSIAAQAQARSSSSSSSAWRRWWALAAVPAVAMAALTIAVLRPVGAGDDVEVVRDKGGAPVLVATRVTAAGAEPLVDGAAVARGDVVQLGWVAPSSSSSAEVHGVVVSIDGRGTVTRHLPLSATAAAPVLANRGVLPSSYELDDAPRFERFFLVTGSTVDVDVVMQAATMLAHGEASSTAPLAVPAGLSVSALLVRK